MVLTEIRLRLFLFYRHSCVLQHMTGSDVVNARKGGSVISVLKPCTTEMRNLVQRCVRWYQVRNSAGPSAILTEVFPGFPPPKLQENASINPLTPNDHYSGRTAPLTSKRCILYIYKYRYCIF